MRAQRLRGGLDFRSPRLRPTGIPSFSQNLTPFPSFEVPSAPVLQARATVRQKENKNKYGGQLLHPLDKLSCHQCLAVPCQLVAFRCGCYLGILGRLLYSLRETISFSRLSTFRSRDLPSLLQSTLWHYTNPVFS